MDWKILLKLSEILNIWKPFFYFKNFPWIEVMSRSSFYFLSSYPYWSKNDMQQPWNFSRNLKSSKSGEIIVDQSCK